MCLGNSVIDFIEFCNKTEVLGVLGGMRQSEMTLQVFYEIAMSIGNTLRWELPAGLPDCASESESVSRLKSKSKTNSILIAMKSTQVQNL
jgi:hypothetical protein